MGEELPLDPEQVQQPEGQDQTDHIDVVDQSTADPSVMQPQEQEGSYRVQNEEKARFMAESMDRSRNRSPYPEHIANFAADHYEVGKLAKRERKDSSEIFKLMSANKSAMLRYGNELANNQQEYGENLHPGLKVFQTVHNLAERYPSLLEGRLLANKNMTVILEPPSPLGHMNLYVESYDPSTNTSVLSERWEASPFSDRNFGNIYTVETYLSDDEANEGGFDEVKLIKSRRMQSKDAQHLEDLLKDANFDPDPAIN